MCKVIKRTLVYAVIVAVIYCIIGFDEELIAIKLISQTSWVAIKLTGKSACLIAGWLLNVFRFMLLDNESHFKIKFDNSTFEGFIAVTIGLETLLVLHVG